MESDATKPDLEFQLGIQLEAPQQPGRYTLTGVAPGQKRVFYVFRNAQDLVKYLEWLALGSPQLH